MGDETLYNYDLGKTMLPGFLTKGVRIRDSWVRRCKRYLGAGEPDLNRLVNFIKAGLIDRRAEGFNDKALDSKLTIAQQWVLLHLVLKDGIPEWVRDHEKDEDAPELIVEEPKDMSQVAKAATAVAGAAVKPVTSLGQMMGVTKSEPTAPAEETPVDEDKSE